MYFRLVSNVLCLALHIELHQLNVPFADVGDFLFELVDLHHQLFEDLGPLFVFAHVLLLFLLVFCYHLLVFLFPLLDLVVFARA